MRNLEIENLANQIIGEWEKFKRWYLFLGGKEYYFKKNETEKRESENLVETRDIADVWRTHQEKAEPRTLVELEKCVWLTLCVEWGEDSEIFFDNKMGRITCKNKDKVLVI